MNRPGVSAVPAVPATPEQPAGRPPEAPLPPAVARWIRTDCGRAKYRELAARPGPLARLRLAWFLLIGALRDLPLSPAAPPPPGRDGPPG